MIWPISESLDRITNTFLFVYGSNENFKICFRDLLTFSTVFCYDLLIFPHSRLGCKYVTALLTFTIARLKYPRYRPKRKVPGISLPLMELGIFSVWNPIIWCRANQIFDGFHQSIACILDICEWIIPTIFQNTPGIVGGYNGGERVLYR